MCVARRYAPPPSRALSRVLWPCVCPPWLHPAHSRSRPRLLVYVLFAPDADLLAYAGKLLAGGALAFRRFCVGADALAEACERVRKTFPPPTRPDQGEPQRSAGTGGAARAVQTAHNLHPLAHLSPHPVLSLRCLVAFFCLLSFVCFLLFTFSFPTERVAQRGDYPRCRRVARQRVDGAPPHKGARAWRTARCTRRVCVVDIRGVAHRDRRRARCDCTPRADAGRDARYARGNCCARDDRAR